MTDKKMAEFAAKVANDVTEDIDCRETRKQLREVIRFWSLEHCRESGRRALAQSENVTLRALIEIALAELKRSRDPRARAAFRMVRKFTK